MAEWFPLDFELQGPGPHDGHTEHLCVAHAIGFLHNNFEAYKKYVKNPKFICKQCGRAAASEDNLCDPEPL